MKIEEKTAHFCRVWVAEKGEATIEQMPRNQKESNDQEMSALMKEPVGETSRSETPMTDAGIETRGVENTIENNNKYSI